MQYRIFIQSGIVGLMVLCLTACSSGGETVSVGDYQLTLVTKPDPLEVGRSAVIRLQVDSSQQQTGMQCQVRMRQFMPGMEMSADHTYILLAPAGKPGHYQANSSEFSMGGGWELEFEVDCGQAKIKHNFARQLEWPE